MLTVNRDPRNQKIDGQRCPRHRQRSRSLRARPQVLGITGVGGAGKSSVVDELLLRMRRAAPGLRVAILSRQRVGGRTAGCCRLCSK